ncbi:sensor histidine kinase [Streptomyces sp. 71268]|uniref:sensor histidine kinase n=1 Tax=Streptomyces sp. 71268 TaxID=3002640 RepID=UPI0023F72C73|nr:sensor histidine kinase [Streptomyces sp. 71268]WEV28227.1 sensor histidine kinase [Streptomyces sp. 71268]
MVTVLAWGGALVYPLVLFAVAQAEPRQTVAVRVMLLVVATLLPLSLLRRGPVVALPLMLAGTLAASTPPEISWEIVYLLVLVDDVALGYVAARRSRRVSLSMAALTLLTHVTVVSTGARANDDALNASTLVTLTVLVAWTSGRRLRERREHAAALRDQAAARAVTAERLRIARELHDMIAHSIGVIAIQAGVGGRVIDSQPAEARKALSVIEDTSRETLAGLRRTLVALRRDESDTGGAVGPREPAPGLDDLGKLAATTADAGVRVELRWEGTRRPLPADIDLAGYRIVQEALTNVIRHARTDACRVTVSYQQAAVAVEVTDAGRGGTVGPGAGLGIVGMRERAALLGGRFTAGPRPGGGFTVAAVLPEPDGWGAGGTAGSGAAAVATGVAG